MKVNVSFSNTTLLITLNNVSDNELNRAARIEVELLKSYSRHSTLPRKLNDDNTYTYQFVRDGSALKVVDVVREVLKGFCFTEDKGLTVTIGEEVASGQAALTVPAIRRAMLKLV